MLVEASRPFLFSHESRFRMVLQVSAFRSVMCAVERTLSAG